MLLIFPISFKGTYDKYLKSSPVTSWVWSNHHFFSKFKKHFFSWNCTIVNPTFFREIANQLVFTKDRVSVLWLLSVFLLQTSSRMNCPSLSCHILFLSKSFPKDVIDFVKYIRNLAPKWELKKRFSSILATVNYPLLLI